MENIILPGTLITQFTVFGLNLLRPVTTTGIHQVDTLWLAVGQTLKQFHDVRLVRNIFLLLPKVRHGGIGVVTAHGPDGVGIRSRQEDFELCARLCRFALRRTLVFELCDIQRQNAVVLEEHY